VQGSITRDRVIFRRCDGACIAHAAGMRSLAILWFLAACTEHGKGGGTPNLPDDPDQPPDECGCISDEDLPMEDFCCDSVTCFFDDEEQWQIVICDVLPPPPPASCELCVEGEICVQAFDGFCGFSTSCVPEIVVCPDNACTPDCEAAYCNAPFQCQVRVACGTESPGAFTCYGP
jgi:hypothetical protein